ncbi:FHA domain-containing protein [Leucobacter coleopterorum]|uniref:FHA domain-containing protein n=1 Tax=Leucobacter coleopterorum TaxID=2714933 RepID=A0ABX6JVF4_9MICO|nr:FHA domain-containing protein [Leucobacter coleopterorum]QIM18242.1 FHA domain-containing protein [Leucobacter coleopterorum]
MAASTRFDVDVSFEVTLPEADGQDVKRVTGTIQAAGTDIVLNCDSPEVFMQSGVKNQTILRAFAEVLASRGTTVSVEGPDGMVVRLGDLQSPLVQRMLLRSRHIEFGPGIKLTSLLGNGASRSQRDTVSSLIPPLTLSPILPTFGRNIVRTVTTTNYGYGAGHPRLAYVLDSDRWNGSAPSVCDLTKKVTTIGSAQEADLVLPGARLIHAEIRHTPEDEYVLIAHGPASTGIDPKHTTAKGAEGGVLLRNGARIGIGDWRIAFFREEYADHGRPFGAEPAGNGRISALNLPERSIVKRTRSNGEAAVWRGA